MWCEVPGKARENGNLEGFFGVSSFFNYAIADGIFNLLFPDKTALQGLTQHRLDDFQLCFDFG
jgi:hypothetical protein